MDESGRSGEAGASTGGNGADSHDRTRVNGWASTDSPWANNGAALEQGVDTPPWRRPSDGRTFGRQQVPPEQPFGAAPSSAVFFGAAFLGAGSGAGRSVRSGFGGCTSRRSGRDTVVPRPL